MEPRKQRPDKRVTRRSSWRATFASSSEHWSAEQRKRLPKLARRRGLAKRNTLGVGRAALEIRRCRKIVDETDACACLLSLARSGET